MNNNNNPVEEVISRTTIILRPGSTLQKSYRTTSWPHKVTSTSGTRYCMPPTHNEHQSIVKFRRTESSKINPIELVKNGNSYGVLVYCRKPKIGLQRSNGKSAGTPKENLKEKPKATLTIEGTKTIVLYCTEVTCIWRHSAILKIALTIEEKPDDQVAL